MPATSHGFSSRHEPSVASIVLPAASALFDQDVSVSSLMGGLFYLGALRSDDLTATLDHSQNL